MLNRIPYELKKKIRKYLLTIFLSVSIMFVITYFGFETGIGTGFLVGFFSCWLVEYGWNLKPVVKIRRRFMKPKEFSIYVAGKMEYNDIELNKKIGLQYFSLFKRMSMNIIETSRTEFVLRYQNKQWIVKTTKSDFRCSPSEFIYIFENRIKEKGKSFKWSHFVDVDKLTSKNITDRMQFLKDNPNVFYKKGQLYFEDIFTGEYYKVKENIFDKESWIPMVQANKGEDTKK